MQTIGILGGLGPQATIDFERRLYRVAQQLVPTHRTTGYPQLVSWFFNEPPVVMAPGSVMPTSLPPVNPRLLEVARTLGGHVDFLVIPSNGVHLWQKEIEHAAGKPVVSMVEAVVDEVRRRRWRRVGLVDFRPASWGVYSRLLEQLDVECMELPGERQYELYGVMRAVVEGRNGSAEAAQMQAAITLLRTQGANGIILACTEFPLALEGELDADTINPAELLATAALLAALA